MQKGGALWRSERTLKKDKKEISGGAKKQALTKKDPASEAVL